jgi:transposase-like protein
MNTIRCPSCNSAKIVKRGNRKTKTGIKQLYQCKKCLKRFSISALPSFTFPAEVILSAPVYYYLGYSIDETRKRIKGRHKEAPSLSTVSNWIKDFGKYSVIKNHREEIQKFDKPHKIIKRKLLKHKQNYLFQVHRYKLEKFTQKQKGLKQYLYDILVNNIDINSDEFAMRASECELGITIKKPKSKKNYVTKIADIALKAALTNFQRHAVLQRFFLATDISTVAVEVPVYLAKEETKGIIKKEGGLLGHIDFLQVFDDRVTILDYKPKASSDKKVAEQLLLYAIALSKRTKIHLKQINCTWFDENNYYMFPAMQGYRSLKDYLYK